MAVLWGSGWMLSYDCLRMLRMMIRQRKGIQAAEEAVFWMLAAGCLFGLLYRFNNGAVRNYIVCGMGTGMVLYRWLLSSMVVRWMLAVLRPIRQIVRIFKTFVKNTGNTLQSAAAKRTIKGRKLQQRKRRSKHKGSMKVITLIVLVLCGVFGVFTWQNTQKSEQYALVQENLQQQIDDEEENQKAIEEQAEYQKTDAYIEDLAREKLGLVHEDEIIFKKK